MGMSERIKERRLAMNYTQEELAQKLGLQKSAIAKYENGRVENIKRSVIAQMAKTLDCSPSYLMGWEDHKEIETAASALDLIYNDKNIELTKNEVKILSYLINHKGEIVSRELLMEHLWNSDFFVDDSTLTVNITRLRKKLDEIGIKNVIETRRGLGYIMR